MMEDKAFLTRTECTAMKGIAILGIMLHNYCHWLKGIARENEYTWLQWKNDRLMEVLQQPDELLPMHLVSYFGHYGVPVFLFLSGFGLVMKYERGNQPEASIWRFTRYNYLKLFRIFIVGFVFFTMLDAFTPGIHRYLASEVLAMLGMYANFLEHPSEVVWPGPYWYFSVTMQLYILYRMLFYRWRHWSIVVVLMVGCWLWQVFYLDDMEILERLRYNLVGGMLPFGMGVLAGRWPLNMGPSPTVHFPILIVSIFLIILMCFNIQSWLFVPALIVVGTIALVKLIPCQVMPYVVWLGTVSAAIFVTHPIVRKIFVRPYIQEDMYAGLLLYVVATLLLSWLMKKIIDQIPSPKL
jgi:peptidoglycan/LPS O-acetylase OafA/YrhL